MLSEIQTNSLKQLSNFREFSTGSTLTPKDYFYEKNSHFQLNSQLLSSKETMCSSNKSINTLQSRSTYNLYDQGSNCQFFINEDFLIIPKRHTDPGQNIDSKKLSFTIKKGQYLPKIVENSPQKGLSKQFKIDHKLREQYQKSNAIEANQQRKKHNLLISRLSNNHKVKYEVNRVNEKKIFRLSQIPSSPYKNKEYNTVYSKSKYTKNIQNNQNQKQIEKILGSKKASYLGIGSCNLEQKSKSPFSLTKMLKKSQQQLKKSINNFYIFRILENSQYFQNYQCIDKKTFTIYNLKKINKKKIQAYPNQLEILIRRIKLQFNSNHPNIIKIYDIFSDNEYVYIIEEYMQGGTLRDYLNQKVYMKRQNKIQNIQNQIKQESAIVQKLYSINSALSWIHTIPTTTKQNQERKQNTLIHGDLKPQKIFQSFGCCKVSLISSIKIQKSYQEAGSYTCPEIVVGHKMTYRSDMWNLGLVLFQLCSNRSLFKPYWDQMEIIMQIDYNQEINKLFHRTQSLKNVLKGLLKLMPQERLTTTQVASSQVIKIYEFISILLEKTKPKKELSQLQSFRQLINKVESKKYIQKRMSRQSQSPTVNYFFK